MNIIRVGIVGISGYSGLEAFKILIKHPEVRVAYTSANNSTGPLHEIWPELRGQTDLVCKKFDLDQAIDLCDLLFLAVPHTVSMEITPQLLKAGKRVIDISADYRLKDPSEYQNWYKKPHTDENNLAKAVYGLPELYREKIKKANLVANPGCYPTAALLALIPVTSLFTDAIESIIIDAKSGVSGAGRKMATDILFSDMSENFKAYKVLNHQHTPEIDQYLSQVSGKEISVTFVPHLLPIYRGLLETCYVQLNKTVSAEEIHLAYQKFYKTEPFVRVLDLDQQVEIKNVAENNYCDISIALKGKMLVITSAIDNLVKGASGQAVQNMNIMYNFKEGTALK